MEREHPALSPQAIGAIRTFAYFLSSGTHHLLKNVKYLDLFGEEPSAIEQTFAIFMNNLKADADGNILNVRHADKRATDYLRMYVNGDPAEFEFWEVELHQPPRP